MTLKKKPFQNTVEKGENADNQHFLLFPQCFLPSPKQVSIFHSHLFCRLQTLLIWTPLKNSHLVRSSTMWFRVESMIVLFTSIYSFSYGVLYMQLPIPGSYLHFPCPHFFPCYQVVNCLLSDLVN